MFWPEGCVGGGRTHQFGTGDFLTMRTPSKPFFKLYEIVAIVAFVVAAIGVGSLGLVY